MEQLTKIVQEISSFMWGWPMIIMLLGTHLYLTIRLRFPQLHILKALRLSVSKDKDAGGDVSQFGALATSLAATIGTGNIIGVATAVALGGPGAVFWCWLTGVLGMSTKYAEGLLAVKYRIKNSSGEMIGGPMYALERGLGLKWLGVLFCIFTALAAFGIGNTVQANSISLLLNESYGVSPHDRYPDEYSHGFGSHRRSKEHRQSLYGPRTHYGLTLCRGMYLYSDRQPCLFRRIFPADF